MVELKLTEQPTPERYVAGTLPDEEVARFEEMMIDRPALAADVNVRRRIKAGLALLEQRQELDPLLTPASRRPQFLRYAAAAAVLVVVAGLWSTWRGQSVSPIEALLTSSEIGATKVAANFMLVRTRGAAAPEFNVQRKAGLVQFRILVDETGGAPFAVRLTATEQSGANAFKDSTIPQTTDGFAEIYVDPRELSSGDYVLSVRSQSGAEQLFPFKLNVSE
jgi:hypothetical protein